MKTIRPSNAQPVRLPPLADGLRVGLYGGSFNPAHAGHRHVSLLALKRLRLDRVWWIVTPGNPLKTQLELASSLKRVTEARHLARHPSLAVTAFEEEIGARYTVETLHFLVRRYPRVRFVWIMGADNLVGFHLWRGWQDIARMMPIAVIDRPGNTLNATRSRMASAFSTRRIREEDAGILADLRAPAWVFLHGPRSNLSSSTIRQTRIK